MQKNHRALGGYYFTTPMAELPLFQLTEAELVSVFVAQKALEAYKGTAFEQPLRTELQKLQAATGSANVSVPSTGSAPFHCLISTADAARGIQSKSVRKLPSPMATGRR